MTIAMRLGLDERTLDLVGTCRSRSSSATSGEQGALTPSATCRVPSGRLSAGGGI